MVKQSCSCTYDKSGIFHRSGDAFLSGLDDFLRILAVSTLEIVKKRLQKY